MRSRVLIAVAATLASLLVAAGCGGGTSIPGLASVAPPDSLIFIRATVRPAGQLKSDTEAVAQKVAGLDLGEAIVEELESAAREENEPFDYETDIEPWLGEEGGVFLTRFDGEEFGGEGSVLQVTDASAAQRYIDQKVRSAGGRPLKEASYRGVEYSIETGDNEALGLIGDLIVGGKDVRAFKEAVDASQGDSLADQDRYADAISGATAGSLADAYIDLGALFEQGGEDSEQALTVLRSAGIDASEATAVASLVPGRDRVELDVSGDFGDQETPSGDASKLLGSLPADSFAALAGSDFGSRVMEAIDSLDEAGIPGEIPPHKLKSGLKEAGIDLEAIVGSLRDIGIFAIGADRGSLGGAAVFTIDDPTRASNTVSNIGLLLSASHTPGVTALSGKTTGFSISSPELGSNPLVVAAEGDRIAVGYGLPATMAALEAEPVRTLADNPDYVAATTSLGDTPISGFVDGPGALRLADSLVPAYETGFEEAKPYLAKIRFLALGSESDDDLTTAKLIVGLAR